jgi:hypothetical protein
MELSKKIMQVKAARICNCHQGCVLIPTFIAFSLKWLPFKPSWDWFDLQEKSGVHFTCS